MMPCRNQSIKLPGRKKGNEATAPKSNGSLDGNQPCRDPLGVSIHSYPASWAIKASSVLRFGTTVAIRLNLVELPASSALRHVAENVPPPKKSRLRRFMPMLIKQSFQKRKLLFWTGLPFNASPPFMIGGALRMPGGGGYGRMPVMTDMSNRSANTTAWQRGSMSAVLKIAVMIFVSLLSMVALIGAFGLISGPSMKLESHSANGKSTLPENGWLFDWNANIDPGIGLLYFDDQAYLDRPSIPLKRAKFKQNQEEDIYEGLARSQIDQLASLRGTLFLPA